MRQTAAFDACATTYDAALNRGISISGESKEYFIRRRIEWLSLRLRQHGCRPGHVLDYGCGTGGSAPDLLDHLPATSVTGVDVSSHSIDVARSRYAHSNVRFSTLDQWQAAGEYDLAYCNGVFHHIEPACRGRALACISRALSVRGYFAFWENNPWNPGTRLVMRRIPFDRDAETLSPPVAKALVRKCGFSGPMKFWSLFYFPRQLAVLRSLEGALAGLPLGAQYCVLGAR